MILVLSVGGLIQGFEMNQASESLGSAIDKHGLFSGIAEWFGGFKARNGAVPFIDIVRGQVPWLVLRSITGVLLFVGHIAFLILMVMNVHAWGRARLGPTLFSARDRTYSRLMTGESEGAEA